MTGKTKYPKSVIKISNSCRNPVRTPFTDYGLGDPDNISKQYRVRGVGELQHPPTANYLRCILLCLYRYRVADDCTWRNSRCAAVGDKTLRRAMAKMRLFFPLLLLLLSYGGTAEWWRFDSSVFVVPDIGHPQFKNTRAFDVLANGSLFLRFNLTADPARLHSCYDYQLVSQEDSSITRSGTFCYPRISIIGLPKAGTSAFFHLLHLHPNTTTLCRKKPCQPHHKEFCLLVSLTKHSVLDFFDALPSSIGDGKVFTVGCIYPSENIAWRQALRLPSTLYVVLTREYSELMWSAYNYWCDPKFDPVCPGTLLPKKNIRTPELFEAGVTASVKGISVHAPISLLNSCQNAKNQYTGYFATIGPRLGWENLFILASEELSSNAQAVWSRLSLRINTPSYGLKHPGMSSFSRVRVNTGSKKCFNCLVDAKTESRKKRMPQAAKRLLETCWYKDCLAVANWTGYRNYSCVSSRFLQRSLENRPVS